MAKPDYLEQQLDVVPDESYDNEELDITESDDDTADGEMLSDTPMKEGEADNADTDGADKSDAEKSESEENDEGEREAPVKSFASALGFAIASGVFIILNVVFICFAFKASSDLSVAFSMLMAGGENAVMAGISMATSVMLLMAYGICSLIISIIVLVLARYSRKHSEGVLSIVSLCEMIASGVLAVFPLVVAISAVLSIGSY